MGLSRSIIERKEHDKSMDLPYILVVDDDPHMRQGLETALKHSDVGYMVDVVSDAEAALKKIKLKKYDVVVTDLRMPGMSGLELLKKIKSESHQTEVLLITAYASVDTALEAMKNGALDYLIKPFNVDDLERAIGKALDHQVNPQHLQGGLERSMIGESRNLLQTMALAKRAAASDATILIQAESGTGKELLARFIHARSGRASKPFIAINCAALPETLLESELFGYVKGAFTDARQNKPGRFVLADGGTLMLDEIAEMPMAIQAKMLRVLQEGVVDPLGSTEGVKINVRIFAVTNKPLHKEVEAGRFREDLYYRLQVIPFGLPPLRKRKSDIPLLVKSFCHKYGMGMEVFTEASMARLIEYDWPGNIRELENVVQRALALADSNQIGVESILLGDVSSVGPWAEDWDEIPIYHAENLNEESQSKPGGYGEILLKPGTSVQAMERALIAITLEETGGNKTKAAEMLGISIRTLRNKLNDYPELSKYKG